MTSHNPSTGVSITAILYHVEGSKGDRYVVNVDPVDFVTRCTCRAGQFGKDCRHQALVREGEAGRPRIRATVRPVTARRPVVTPWERHPESYRLDVG